MHLSSTAGVHLRTWTHGAFRTKGFSLVEALIALALSGVILTLVMTVFLAQNRFYSDVSNRSDRQEGVRSVAELISGEIRALARGGIVVAEPDRLVFRAPLAMGIVCGPGSGVHHTYFPFDGQLPSEGDVHGWGIRFEDGGWAFFEDGWATLSPVAAGASTISSCASAGMDTSGPTSDFIRLDLSSGGGAVESGRIVMLFSEIEMEFSDSVLRPGSLALYRGVAGSTLLEYAAGLSSASGFEYRLEDGTLVSSASGAELDAISMVRASVAFAPATGAPSGGDFGWTVDVPLRNALP